MGRTPCCEKMGLKKGPWSPDEDQTLITYIQKYGHVNWRALPKQAGLLRCGKSCRLRWMNYLRPDIKRGNFGREEEETIIKLHEMLGNRWSAIAAKLPGRTDNEIKNVWHTHLKKRLKQSSHNVVAQEITKRRDQHSAKAEVVVYDNMEINNRPTSPPQSSTVSDISSITITAHDNNNNNNNKNTSMKANSLGNFSDIAGEESFWSEVLSTDQSNYSETLDDFSVISEPKLQFPFLPLVVSSEPVLHALGSNNMYNDDMDFWQNIFTKAEDLQELLAEL